jgi:acyl carrier protein
MTDKLIKYIEDEILAGQDIQLEADEDLLGSGLLDSLAAMRLIAYIEKEFDIKVPPQDMTIENFMTVEAIANYLGSVKA